MTSHSPVRYLSLLKRRPRFLTATVVLSTLLAAGLGLLSPYVYTSTSVVQYQPKATSGQNLFHDDSGAFHKALMLLQSSLVLTMVAKTLEKEPLDLFAYFPKTIPILDFRTRFELVARHLGPRVSDESSRRVQQVPQNVVVSLLSRHLRVGADANVQTMSVTYEAGDPETAQKVCNLITAAFVELDLAQQKEELKRQEQYIEDALARQVEMIRSAEKDMRVLVQDHPSMAVAGDRGYSVSPAAQRYVKKQERLEAIEGELDANHKHLLSLTKELGGANSLQNEISGNIVSKVTEELSDLEFRRLNSVKFGGYTPDHPSIYNLDKRIKELKDVLANLGGNRTTTTKGPSRGDTRAMFQQVSGLKEKNRALRAEKEVLIRSLTEEDARFRKAVQVNFEFDSIGRNLSSSQAIMNEMYRDLQKVRLTLSGITSSATVVSPGSYHPHSTSLSIQRRIFFSTFVNLVMVISLLILWEIFRPTLLVADDLRALRLAHLGQFKWAERGLAELSSILRDLGEGKGGADDHQKKVLSLLPFTRTLKVAPFVRDLAESAHRDNCRVAVVFIDVAENPADVTSETVTIERIPREDALLVLRRRVQDLKQRHEFVIIAETAPLTEPIEALLGQVSDHFVYLTQHGVTELSPIAHARYLPEIPNTLRHHSVIVEASATDDKPGRDGNGGWFRKRSKAA